MGRLRGEKGACTPDFSGLDFTPDETTRFTIVACGTSWHAALAGKYFIEQVTHRFVSKVLPRSGYTSTVRAARCDW